MTKATPDLNIRLFGAPEILVSGTSLNLNHLKVRALLFYLAATGQAHTRDHLATLLWGESDSSDAHHSLRSSIYRLRQSMLPGPAQELLLTDGELLSLRPGAFACDVLEFYRLLSEGDESALGRAVALYRGSFLQGFTLSDAPFFDEWVRGEEARHSQACQDVLDRLAGLAEMREDWGMAIDYCQKMAWLDPLAELVQQRLMRLYLRQREMGLAVNQYKLYENRLQQELGISPSPEIKDLLYDALRQQRSSVMLANSVVANPQPVGQPFLLPFVGRDRLLQQLTDISRDVQVANGRTVLLEGEGGVGKSRLLDELASRLIAGTPPWLVLRGACSPFDDLLSPGPFLEALQNGAPGELSSLLAEPELNLPDTRGRFSWRILQIIRSLTGTVPLLLIIEDLQWANSATLNLFGLLSTRLHHLSVLLVGTVQHVQAIPSLQRLVSLGRRRGELQLLSLAPLTLGAVSNLLNASGINPGLVETLAEWLHARSAGSPYLLTEILAQLRSEAILQPVGDGWQLDTNRWFVWRTTFTLPETTYDLVAWRLADLSADARHLLNILAVAGQPLPFVVVGEFLGLEQNAFFSLVDDLGARGLVIEPPGSLLALPHHLLRETLLRRVSDLRRRAIYMQLAQVLETRNSSGSDAALRQIAMYAVAGEDIVRARRYGLQILLNLPQEYTGEETIDFIHHLYDLLFSSASPEEMVQLTHALGTLHQFLGHLNVAADWHRKNLEWAVRTGDLASQAEAYFEMSELALMTNDFQGATQTAREGLAKIKGSETVIVNQPLWARGHRLLGAALAMDGSDLDAAQNHLHEAVRINRETGNQRDLCAALFELGNIAAQRGELREALAFYDESARAAENGHIHYYFALARNNFAYHSLLLGQIDAARQAVAQGVKVAEAYDLLAALLHLYSTKGEIFLYLGEWKEAEESFKQGLALADDLGNLERQAGYRLGLALAARGRKDLESAVRLLVEALALIGERGYWHLHTRLQIWLAEALFEQSNFVQAAQMLDPAVALAHAHQRSLLLAQGECLHAQLLAANGDWPAANDLFDGTLKIVSRLGLPLETARIQAAWGKTALHYSSAPEQSRALIDSARKVFVACDARADLADMS